jgi:hypothetical protein
MPKTITQYRTAKRNDVQLIRDRDIIAEIAGYWSENPRPRCGKCKRPTEILRGYDGREVGRWCEEDRYFWVKTIITKTVKVVVYEPWIFEEDST